MQSTTHKIGDTYQRIGRYNLGAGDWTATSAVWGYGAALEHVKLQDLAVTLVALGAPDVDGNTHALTVLATATETATWPEALLASDIVFSQSAVVRSSEMYQISSGRWATSDSDNPLAVIPAELLPAVQGPGVPTGGTTGQVLAKASDDDYDTEWVDQTGGGGAGVTDLAYTGSPTNGVVTSSTGTDATLPAADGANAGLMLPAQVTKLAGIEAGAQVNTVTSVAGRTGAVTLAKGDVGLGNVDNTADADKPVSTAMATALSAKEATTNKGAANGYASLDSGGQIPAAQIPAIAITEYLGSAASQSAMLALSGQKGDWCTRSDTGTVFVITGANPAILGGWTELVYPAAPVSSVAGRTGAVTLASSDLTDTTAAGRALLDDPDASAQRATLGLGDAATRNVGATAGTVAAGDDSRMTDARAPTAHTHPSTAISDSTATGRAVLTAADAAAARTAIGVTGTNTGDETGARVAALMHAASAKTTLVDADEIAGTDSAASFGLIRTTAANLWAYIKSKADAIYQATLVSGANIKTVNSTSLLGSGNITVSASPGGSTTQIQYNNAGALAGASGITTTGTELAIAGGTVTTSTPVLNVTQTWNAAGVTFTGKDNNFTSAASATGSILENWRLDGTSKVNFRKDGAISSTGPIIMTIGARGSNGWDTDGRTVYVNGGTIRYGYNYGNAFELGSTAFASSFTVGTSRVGAGANADPGGIDTTFSRISAGLWGVGTGAAGSFAGSLKLTNLIGVGAVSSGMVAKTADYTLTLNDHAATFDASGAPRTATLPPLSTVTAGQEYIAIKIDSSANALTLDGNAVETINGASNISTTTQWGILRVKANSDRSAWVTF